MEPFSYEVLARDPGTAARLGRLHTPHGIVETPAFMPVGTQATVKALTTGDLRSAGAQIILSNTYHLHLRPGSEAVAQLGGLHGFAGWNRPILTDSGGFQVFSLAQKARGAEGLVALDEDGVTFRSHLDGSLHRFTPEIAIEIQERLGADIIMAFDQCSPTDAGYEETRAGMERTHRWAERCVSRWLKLEGAKSDRPPQALFGIIQGGAFEDLRCESARFIASLGLPGIAIGGESIGYSKELTKSILEWIAGFLPEDRPRYAMGVGDPIDFFSIVERGVDMFDSVLPTRMARNGTLLTPNGRLKVVNAEYSSDPRPIEPGCDCETCRTFSRGYLRHLFKAESLLAYRLATIHNVRFCLRLTERIREAVRAGRFAEMKAGFLNEYA